MGREIDKDDEWHYPKPRFRYWWVCHIAFVLVAAYVMYGFVLSGEASMLEYVLFIIGMILIPGTGCYKVKKSPNEETPTKRAENDIKMKGGTQSLL